MLTDEPFHLRLIHCALHLSAFKKDANKESHFTELKENKLFPSEIAGIPSRNPRFLVLLPILSHVLHESACLSNEGSLSQICRIHLIECPLRKTGVQVPCSNLLILNQRACSYRDKYKVGCKCWIIQSKTMERFSICGVVTAFGRASGAKLLYYYRY